VTNATGSIGTAGKDVAKADAAEDDMARNPITKRRWSGIIDSL
jgi:hypothetical protein